MNILDQFDSPAEENPFDQFDHIHASDMLPKANHEGSREWDTVKNLTNVGLIRLAPNKAKAYGLKPGYYTKEELEQALIKKGKR